MKTPAANTVMDSTTATNTPVTKQSYFYNGLGEVITVKDTLDRATRYDYDNVGRVKSGISPMNIEMGASFNDMLRTVTTTSPITLTSSATTESASDELGRMTSTKQLNSDPTKSDILQRSTAYEVGQDPFRVSSADGNGNPKTGEKPGYLQTPAERKASANDRTRMQPATKAEQNSQGGQMSQYSKEQKKNHGL